jgi:hypothetical protein
MRGVVQTLGELEASDVTVLVQGETGTGKELVARAIHLRSGLEWQRGFYPLELTSASTSRWSDAKSVLAIDNPRDKAVLGRISTRVCTGRREPAKFTIRSEDLDYSVLATSECADVRLSFLLHPGRTFIRFATDAPPVDPPVDARALHFRLEDFGFDLDDGSVDILQNM